MQAFLSNPFIARLLGAAGAGVTTWVATGFKDWHSALAAGAAFAIYGAAHSAATSAAPSTPPSAS